jgi:hypothetical protein
MSRALRMMQLPDCEADQGLIIFGYLKISRDFIALGEMANGMLEK